MDEIRKTANQKWNQLVKPSDWKNPVAKGQYNLVVVGGGTAGLVAAAGAAGLGAKVALIEQDRLGGDCLNAGCVPSKSLLAIARRIGTIRATGCELPASVSFESAMTRLAQLRAEISHHDSAERFANLGVDVFLGRGQFVSDREIQVGDQTLRFRKAVLATGSRARSLDCEIVGQPNLLTNESLFSLEQLPPRLLVVGGGPIGCEMAQAFARFGSRVTLLQRGASLLDKEDGDAARLVKEQLERDGVSVMTETEILRVAELGNGSQVTWKCLRSGNVTEAEQPFDALLIAIGRQPALDRLGLEAAGIQADSHGLLVDDYYRTTNRHVFAAGDVVGDSQFTHAADFMSRAILQNALFLGRKKRSRLVVPRCTYTMPELAAVGMTAQAAEEKGIAIQTLRVDFSTVDRSVLEGQTEGWAEVRLKSRTDQILGATVVGEQAGEMISQFSLAMTHRWGLSKFAATMYPYPTVSEAIRKLGDQYNRSRLTPWISQLFQAWLRWQR